MTTIRVCIEIEESTLHEMKDLFQRLQAENSADKRTFEEWVADIAVWGQKPDRKWLQRYGRER